MDRRSIKELFRRLDPAPSPSAPGHGVTFVFCFSILALFTMWLLIVHRYLPGTDTPYHAYGARVWIDAGKAGTPYAGYEPRHVFEANTLLYDVVGILSIVFSPFTAYRIASAYYFIGFPLACVYALRAFGRSPWGSLLAFPLCYNEAFSSGYMSFNFAAPTFVLAIVEYWRFTARPTWRRGLVVALLFLFVFLSHAHVYLWLGVIVVMMLLGKILSWRAIVGSAVVGLPSLLVFRSWYARGYGQGHAVNAGPNVSLTDSMTSLPIVQKFTGGILQTFSASLHPWETHVVLALGVLVIFAMGLQRAQNDRTSTIPELAVIVTAISYYVLPDSLAGQMVAPRQWYMVAWLVPLVVTPVTFKIAPGRALAVIAGILAWTGTRMWMVNGQLTKFTQEEMYGLDDLARTAPKEPGLKIAYAGVDPNCASWKTSHGHTYAFVAAERSYEGPLEPSDSTSVAAVRYQVGPPLPIKHIYFDAGWYADPDIWRYDLILVRRWKPTHEQKAAAESKGTLVAAGGDWELWRRK
jgi:hypothetical protein